jgi:hypothetical protein
MNQHRSARTVSSLSLAVFAVMPWAALSAAEHRRQPLAFVENQGQWPESIAFGVRAGGVTAGLERGAIHLRLRDRDGYAGVLAATVHLRFEGALETGAIEGEEKQRGVYNFFRGRDCARWRSGVPAYASVLYRGLYDGARHARLYSPFASQVLMRGPQVHRPPQRPR